MSSILHVEGLDSLHSWLYVWLRGIPYELNVAKNLFESCIKMSNTNVDKYLFYILQTTCIEKKSLLNMNSSVVTTFMFIVCL